MGLIDPQVAGQLIAAFEADARKSKRIDAKTWEQRSAWHKLKDKLSYTINEEL